MKDPIKDTNQPSGELFIDTEGEAHFICYTSDTDFSKTKEAIWKFICILQRQIVNEKLCPYYKNETDTPPAYMPGISDWSEAAVKNWNIDRRIEKGEPDKASKEVIYICYGTHHRDVGCNYNKATEEEIELIKKFKPDEQEDVSNHCNASRFSIKV